jgi:diadenosine tetraphosphate (Ap4A) HIT family hydrolase
MQPSDRPQLSFGGRTGYKEAKEPPQMSDTCPFCEPDPDRIWFDNPIGMVLWDAFPVTQGHSLVVPKQHAASICDLSPDDQAALWQLAAEARQRLDEDLHPDGFNIGLNDGVAAGQTVMHAHIHIIPRRKGDVVDPRGGIRWVLPEKARYWSSR